jgi:hypothetical protein
MLRSQLHQASGVASSEDPGDAIAGNCVDDVMVRNVASGRMIIKWWLMLVH